MNVITLIGNLGHDPEVITTEKTTIVNFSVADKEFISGEERTIWVSVKCFGRTAEIARDYLAKGSRVGIIGRLTQERWTNPEGEPRSMLRIIADRIELLSRNGKEKENEPF